MADKQIHEYDAAVGIDASADYLLIDPASTGAYNKINRNVMLGLSSAPLGLTDSQSPTNKTFDNTNSLTIKDGNLTLQNSSSTTKQAAFSAASITAGQTRTFTFPDASGTLATIAGTQTLTNKTITSPAISGGTIDNSTITVDSIAGHTTATTVTVANLQIANGVLNTANSVTSTAIADGAIQPKALTSGTGTGWAWSTWTPSFDNVSGGSVNYAKYIQIGKTVHFKIKYTLGGAGVSGIIIFTTPVTMASLTAGDHIEGIAGFYDSSADFKNPGVVQYSTSTKLFLVALTSDSTYVGQSASSTSSTIPFTWAVNDFFSSQGTFEAA